jgi:enoyl-[acyl-carrier protein] reductase I
MGFLSGKRALIVGLASDRSIAWGLAKAMHREGAELALTYQNDKLRERVQGLAAHVNCDITLPCDVASDEQIETVFTHLDDYWDGLDIIVHSVAFAPREELQGPYIDAVTREGFRIAHEISSYSFAALAKAGRALMQGRRGSLLTLSYIGAERSVPNYNVMGLAKASLEANVRYLAQCLGSEGTRVNAISAGPIRTLAAAGITDFKKLLDYNDRMAPLGRGVTIEEVGNAGAFLCSDLASGITGEVLYVDAGFNTVAVGLNYKQETATRHGG